MLLIPRIDSCSISQGYNNDGSRVDIQFSLPRIFYYDFGKSSVLFFHKGFSLTEMLESENQTIKQTAFELIKQVKALTSEELLTHSDADVRKLGLETTALQTDN